MNAKTDARGTTFQYAYDGNNRVSSITAGSQISAYGYEAGSDLRTSASVNGVSSAYSYDAAGRQVSRADMIDGLTFTTGFNYNPTDDLTAISYPTTGATRRLVTLQYDAEHRVTRVSEGATDYASAFVYHPSGQVLSFLSGNGVVNTFTFDAQRYWPTSVAAGGWSLQYQNYDQVGNVRSLVDNRPAYSQTFTYDALDRLVTATGAFGPSTYAYDAHGNRTTAGGTTYTYEPGTLRLSSQGVATFTYDNAGNLLSAPGKAFTYTPDHLLASVTGASATTYRYDADQWRIKTAVAGESPIYFLRGPSGQLLTEWRAVSGAPELKDYILAGSRLIAAVTTTVSNNASTPACVPVIQYDFSQTTGPLYPTTSPGGANFSLPNYWETPVWGDSRYGAALPAFPNLVVAERANIVNGQLTYTTV